MSDRERQVCRKYSVSMKKRGKQGVLGEYEHQACRECSLSAHVAITLNQEGREYAVSVSTRKAGSVQYLLM